MVWPSMSAISSSGTPSSLSKVAQVWRSSFGVIRGTPAAAQMRDSSRRTLLGSSTVPRRDGNTRSLGAALPARLVACVRRCAPQLARSRRRAARSCDATPMSSTRPRGSRGSPSSGRRDRRSGCATSKSTSPTGARPAPPGACRRAARDGTSDRGVRLTGGEENTRLVGVNDLELRLCCVGWHRGVRRRVPHGESRRTAKSRICTSVDRSLARVSRDRRLRRPPGRASLRCRRRSAWRVAGAELLLITAQ